MHLILVFTYGISLKNWDDAGILSREIEPYKKLSETQNMQFTFITFGDEKDIVYSDLFKNLQILPLYKSSNISNYGIINLFKTLFTALKLNIPNLKSSVIKTNQLNGSWVALALKFKHKLPLYTRTGYNLFEFSVRDKKNIFVKYFYYILTQASLLFSDQYSVSSHSDKNYLNKYFIKTKNIHVIPNWVINLKKESLDKRYKQRILSVGRLEEQKNFKTLIKSLSDSQVSLDIVGSGSQELELEELAVSCNAKLNLMGTFDHHELNNLYSKYMIFVLPSSFEGNPKVVLEAMSRGTLVIARFNKNLTEIIKNNLNGILYDEKDNLSEIINFYLNNPLDLEKLTSNAYLTIEKNNLLERIIEKEIIIYNQLS